MKRADRRAECAPGGPAREAVVLLALIAACAVDAPSPLARHGGGPWVDCGTLVPTLRLSCFTEPMPQEEHVRTEGARVTVREGETLTRRIEMPIVCGEPGDGWVDSGRLLRGELAFSCRRDDASTAERLVHRVRIEGLAERLCLGANRMMTVAVKPAWEGQLVLPRGERVRVRVSSLSTRDLSDRCLLRVDGRLASPILAGPAPLFDEPLAGGRAVPLTLDCGGDRGELASIACGVPFAFGENGVPVAGVPREANLERVVLTVTAEPSP